jgi:hypothetical protein
MDDNRTREPRLPDRVAPLQLNAPAGRPSPPSLGHWFTEASPALHFAESAIGAVVLWVWLLYGSLLLLAFLWSLDDARAIYAWVLGTKAINWLIFAGFVTTFIYYEKRPRPEIILPPSTKSMPAVQPTYRTVEPRKYGGVYGKAQPAEDSQIDDALRGVTGGFDDMFEE